jgi:hypothetical protein
MDVVREDAFALDLDHRQPFAVAGLEVRVAADVDLLELERMPRTHAVQDFPSPRAEMTARRREQRDADGYGYRPRVVVASATRCTASP